VGENASAEVVGEEHALRPPYGASFLINSLSLTHTHTQAVSGGMEDLSTDACIMAVSKKAAWVGPTLVMVSITCCLTIPARRREASRGTIYTHSIHMHISTSMPSAVRSPAAGQDTGALGIAHH